MKLIPSQVAWGLCLDSYSYVNTKASKPHISSAFPKGHILLIDFSIFITESSLLLAPRESLLWLSSPAVCSKNTTPLSILFFSGYFSLVFLHIRNKGKYCFGLVHHLNSKLSIPELKLLFYCVPVQQLSIFFDHHS